MCAKFRDRPGSGRFGFLGDVGAAEEDTGQIGQHPSRWRAGPGPLLSSAESGSPYRRGGRADGNGWSRSSSLVGDVSFREKTSGNEIAEHVAIELWLSKAAGRRAAFLALRGFAPGRAEDSDGGGANRRVGMHEGGLPWRP
jgi:hypothetical protein